MVAFDPKTLPDRCNTGHYVYALVDPLTRKIRYIGCTANPRHRWALHCSKKTMPYQPRLLRWISELRKGGKRPELHILLHFPERLWNAEARATEKEFIYWWSIFHPGDLLQTMHVAPEAQPQTA